MDKLNHLKQWQKANVLNWITMSHGYIYSVSVFKWKKNKKNIL